MLKLSFVKLTLDNFLYICTLLLRTYNMNAPFQYAIYESDLSVVVCEGV